MTKGSSFSANVWDNAVILVDKPPDWTSFDVCGKLRGALKVKKVLLSPPDTTQMATQMKKLPCSKSLMVQWQTAVIEKNVCR